MEPLAGWRPFVTGDRRLVHRLAAADAEEHAAREQDAQRREGLRGRSPGDSGTSGVTTEVPELRASRECPDRAEPRES